MLAAREIPGLTLPMVALTTASHWSLWRTRSHYVSDILAGDALGVALALATRRAWPAPAASGPGADGQGCSNEGAPSTRNATSST